MDPRRGFPEVVEVELPVPALPPKGVRGFARHPRGEGSGKTAGAIRSHGLPWRLTCQQNPADLLGEPRGKRADWENRPGQTAGLGLVLVSKSKPWGSGVAEGESLEHMRGIQVSKANQTLRTTKDPFLAVGCWEQTRNKRQQCCAYN